MRMTKRRTWFSRSGAGIALGVAACLAVMMLAGCGRELSGLEKARRDVRKHPRSAEAYLGLGRALFEEKSYNDAYVAFSQARAIAPDDSEPAIETARTDLALGNAPHGIRMAKEAIKLNPKDARAHDILGQLLAVKRDTKPAIKEFKLAIKHDPTFPDAKIHLAYAYVQLKNDKAARETALKAVKAHPDEAAAHYAYGDILESAGQQDLAQKCYRTAIRLDQNHARAMLRLAALLVREDKDLQEARDLSQRAQKINPADGGPAATAAWALFKLGKRDAAIQELYICATSHPFNHKIWMLLSDALRAAGDEEGAAGALQMALQVAPRIPLTPQQRARLGKELASKRAAGKPIAVDVDKILGRKPKGEATEPQRPPDDEASAPADTEAGAARE